MPPKPFRLKKTLQIQVTHIWWIGRIAVAHACRPRWKEVKTRKTQRQSVQHQGVLRGLLHFTSCFFRKASTFHRLLPSQDSILFPTECHKQNEDKQQNWNFWTSGNSSAFLCGGLACMAAWPMSLHHGSMILYGMAFPKWSNYSLAHTVLVDLCCFLCSNVFNLVVSQKSQKYETPTSDDWKANFWEFTWNLGGIYLWATPISLHQCAVAPHSLVLVPAQQACPVFPEHAVLHTLFLMRESYQYHMLLCHCLLFLPLCCPENASNTWWLVRGSQWGPIAWCIQMKEKPPSSKPATCPGLCVLVLHLFHQNVQECPVVFGDVTFQLA